MTYRKLLPLLCSLLAPLACGGGEPEAVGAFIDTADRYAKSICECEYDDLLLLLLGKAPYASKEACLAELPANSAERGCVQGLFNDAEVDYSAVLNCRADAYRQASACLGALTCTDTKRGDCYGQYNDEIKLCPGLPNAVEDQLRDCLYN